MLIEGSPGGSGNYRTIMENVMDQKLENEIGTGDLEGLVNMIDV